MVVQHLHTVCVGSSNLSITTKIYSRSRVQWEGWLHGLVLTKTDHQSGISERLCLVNGVSGEGDASMCTHRLQIYFRSLVKWMITAEYDSASGSSILSGPAKLKEVCLSGLRYRSWKPTTVKGPWVRISPLPPFKGKTWYSIQFYKYFFIGL